MQGCRPGTTVSEDRPPRPPNLSKLTGAKRTRDHPAHPDWRARVSGPCTSVCAIRPEMHASTNTPASVVTIRPTSPFPCRRISGIVPRILGLVMAHMIQSGIGAETVAVGAQPNQAERRCGTQASTRRVTQRCDSKHCISLAQIFPLATKPAVPSSSVFWVLER